MSSVKHLIFIDEALSDFSSLIDNLPENSEWFFVDSQNDGILQIENTAKNYNNLESIQIVSHGNTGSLFIGSTSLNNSNLASYESNLSSIGNSLSSEGDLLVYGCNIAANADGQKFIQGISEYTFADVAASTDLTGPINLGGDSVLEFNTGNITSPIINTESLSEVLWSDSDINTDITTTALKDILKAANNGDGKYNYLEMRNLLEAAAQGGITSAEFTDLKTAYNKISAANAFEKDTPSGSSSDTYVKYITYAAIHTHPANAKWWGGATNTNQVETLGNMHAGMSEAKATKLIKKWFYGEDLPMPVAGGDTANPNAASKVGKYATSNGTMFKADISVSSGSSTAAGVLVTADDMAQGQAGTCWILACLGTLAHAGTGDNAKAGKAIENLIIDPITDDQIWGMKFYDNNKEVVYTTVNSAIPVSTGTSWGDKDKVLFALNPEPVYRDNGIADGIADGDNLSSAGNLTLDGSLVKNGVASMAGGYGKISIKSTGDDTGITFTVKGTDYYGNTTPEVLQGKNATVTQGTRWWKTVSEISVSGATDGVVIAGEKGSTWSVGATKNLHGELWAGLFEKGYAQANSYIANRGGQGENSYKVMESGGAIGLKHLTGLDFQWYGGAASQYKYWDVEKATKQKFVELLEAGAVGYIGGRNATKDANGKTKMVSGHAFMILDYDASTDKFLVRNPWGDPESWYIPEFWATMDEVTSETHKNWVAFSQPITIKTPKTYTYTVTSDASTTGSAVFEGKPVTFTIKRNDVGDETQVYLSTVAGTANGSDYKEYDKVALKFGAQETTKTFVVETFNDALNSEGNQDSFSLALFTKTTQTTATVSSTAYIKDKVPTAYNYAISSSATDANNAVTEGGEITFTITRSKVTDSDADSETTIYLNTAGGTANGSDYEVLTNHKVEFKAFQNTQKITVKTIQDQSDEGKESFNLNLYKDLASSKVGGSPTAQAAGFMEDEWVPSYDYVITSDSGLPSSAKTEGKAITFTITRSGSGTTSKVFISTEDKSATNGDDYIGFSDKQITFNSNQKKITVEVPTKLDTWLEGPEFFELNLYKDANTKTTVASSAGFINNADYQTDYYIIQNSSTGGGSSNGISNAQNLNDDDFIATANQGATSITLGGTKTLNGKVVTIFSAGNDSTAKFVVSGKDLQNQDISETIWGAATGKTAIGKKIFKTVTGVTVDKAVAGNVKVGVSGGDLAINGGTATLNGKFVTITSAGNDSGVKFTVVGTDTANQALTETIYMTTDQLKADTPVSTTVTGTKLFKTVTKISADSATSGNVSAGTMGNGTNEGEDITFTISRSNVNNAADSIFLSTSSGTAKEADFEGFQGKEIKFSEFETSKTVTVKAKSDAHTDDNEYFWLNLYLNKTDLQNDKSSVNNKAYINDVAIPSQHTYAITSNSSADNSDTVKEGEAITFTITRTLNGLNEKSTLFAKTFDGSANTDDYNPISSQVINFGKKELQKTVTVQTKSDALNSESTEDFYFAIFKTADDAENKNIDANWQYHKAYIKNVAAPSYTYTVKAAADYDNPIEEGNDIIFTITRSATGAASTVYVSTMQGTADEEDYTSIDKLAVNFAAQQTTKTVKVSTKADTKTEEQEFVNLNLYKTIEDADAGTLASDNSWASGYMKDKVGTASSDYSYAITSSHSNPNLSDAVTEGNDATFTITRTLATGKTAAKATVYVSTRDGTALTANQDYQFYLNLPVDFKKDELTKEVTIPTFSDSFSDDGEYFFIELYKDEVSLADFQNQDDGLAIESWGKAYIKNDSTEVTKASTYDYSVASSHSTSGAAVNEGNPITFTITRSKVESGNPDAKSTVYVSTSESSAYNDDYQSLNLLPVEFKKDETVKTVDVETIVDTKTETNPEYFWFDLYKTKADADDFNYHAYNKGYIKDDTSLANSIGNYTYTVTSSSSDSNPVKEGGDITFTIERSKSDDTKADVKSTVYVSTTESSAYEDDYVALNLQKIKFKKTETKKVVTVKTKKDSLDENVETFWFDVFKTKADAEDFNFAAYAQGHISNDSGSVTSAATYDYVVSSSHNASNNKATEGSDITFTITRSNTGGGADSNSTIYISTSAGSASTDDFEVITNKAIEFKANETSKQIKVATKKDAEADDGEYFWFDVYKSLSAAENFEYYKWDKGYIADDTSAADALNNYTYTVTSPNTTSNKVTEGGLATFTISRSEIDASKTDVPATVYVATSIGTAGLDDYESVTKQAIEFKANETSKTFTVQTKEDGVTESGGEYFTLELYKTESDLEDGDYTAYGKAFIADNATAALAVSNYTYTVTGDNNTTNKAATEGSDLTFTITRAEVDASQTNVAATIYVSTTHSTTDTSDIESWDKKAVEFLKDELTKTITIKSNTDSETEGSEYFWLDVFKTKADAEEGSFAAYDVGYLKDNTTAATAANTYKYTITTPAGALDPVTEGSDITFTITRTRIDGQSLGKNDKASTVYVGTQDSSATNSDYQAMQPQELMFLPLESTKTVTVKTYKDDLNEQNESFYLGLFKSKGALNTYIENGDESLVDSYAAGYMKDPAAVEGVGTFGYTVTTNSPSNNKKTEGQDITVTITRSVSNGNPGDSTVYINTTAGSADESDYVAQKATPVVFTSSDANGATKTLKIETSTDAISDDAEYFYVDLFKSIADANAGWPYETFDTAYIANGQADASAGRTYTIDNNSKTTSGAKDEGSSVTFTISVDDTSAASKVWVSTVDGTAKAGEDYTALTKKKVKFAQGENTKTVTVDLLNDTDTSDDNEVFYLELYKSKKDAESGNEAEYSKVYINNTSVVDNYYYKVAASHSYSSPQTEGSDITFTITRWSNSQKTIQGTTGDTTLYVSTSAAGSSTSADFEKITSQTLTFKDGEHTKTVAVSTISDSIIEGKHGFYLDVYKNKADADVDNWNGTNGYTAGYMTDASGSFVSASQSSSTPNYTYTIQNMNSLLGNSRTVIEGDEAIFQIIRSDSGTESTVYVSTFISDENGHAQQDDFTQLDHMEVNFGKDELVKEIKTSTLLDNVKNEANEFFYLRMNTDATSDSFEPGVYDKVIITQPTGMLGIKALGGNSGALSGTDTVTVSAASKTTFPGNKGGQFFNDFAFSATTNNGKVVSWGNSTKGGDTSSVASHLTNVSKIFSNATAYAALKTDGSVVTWGNVDSGGTSWDSDGLSVISTLGSNGVLTLGGTSTSSGSATFSKGNKITITSEGNDSGGYFWIAGKNVANEDQTVKIAGANAGTVETSETFKTVSSITFKNGNTDSSTGQAAAGKVTAGHLFSLTYEEATNLNGSNDVTKISSTSDSFAAIHADGSVTTWGNKGTGGDSSSVSSSLDGTVDVRDIYSNMSSYAALREDGTVITWGFSSFGGNSSTVANKITNKSHNDFKPVIDISSTGSAFAAIRNDGSVITWGNSQDGGDSSTVASAINGSTDPTDVVQVYATTSAFAALQKNGAVITWGDVNNGGSTSSIADKVNGVTDVTKIFSTNSAFAALRSDGSLVTWGDGANGGNSSSIAAEIDGDSNGDGNASDTTQDITKVFSTIGAFAAVRADNKVVTWGYNAYGGDSSSVSSIINGTLDADCVSVAATVSAGADFTLGGDQTSSGTASFANAERVTITSTGDDSARTFTIVGKNSAGGDVTENIGGGNKTGVTSLNYFKSISKISVDSGGATSGNVTVGVINKEIKTISSTDKAFAALLKDGSVITWGDSSNGGNSTSVSDKIVMGENNSSAVTSLSSTSGAFSAIKADGSVVTWGSSDLGGDSSAINFSAYQVQGMSGASSGSECVVNSAANTAKKIKSTTLTLKDSGGSTVSGTFITGSDGSLDISSVSDGNYTASYKLTDSQTDSIINALDVSDVLDISSGLNTSPTNKQKVSADTNSDGQINALDVSNVLDLSSGLDNSGATAVLRDASASNPFSSSTFAVSSGSDLTLSAYVLGDMNGTYADIL